MNDSSTARERVFTDSRFDELFARSPAPMIRSAGTRAYIRKQTAKSAESELNMPAREATKTIISLPETLSSVEQMQRFSRAPVLETRDLMFSPAVKENSRSAPKPDKPDTNRTLSGMRWVETGKSGTNRTLFGPKSPDYGTSAPNFGLNRANPGLIAPFVGIKGAELGYDARELAKTGHKADISGQRKQGPTGRPEYAPESQKEAAPVTRETTLPESAPKASVTDVAPDQSPVLAAPTAAAERSERSKVPNMPQSSNSASTSSPAPMVRGSGVVPMSAEGAPKQPLSAREATKVVPDVQSMTRTESTPGEPVIPGSSVPRVKAEDRTVLEMRRGSGGVSSVSGAAGMNKPDHSAGSATKASIPEMTTGVQRKGTISGESPVQEGTSMLSNIGGNRLTGTAELTMNGVPVGELALSLRRS